MKFSLGPTWLVTVAGLALAGSALHGLEAPLWSRVRARQPALRLDSHWAAAGQGLLLGVLGGFRTAAADLAWLRMAHAWEEQDGVATDAWLRCASILDPAVLGFWINGARILAYDVPEWRLAAAGGPGAVPAAARARLYQGQARSALDRLAEAREFHRDSAALWIEQANLELNRLGDVRAAAASYRRAAEQPRAPYYAARLHGELLRRLGEKPRALAWLVQLHPRLPANVESAGAALVLARIRTLERELAVPAARAYRAPAAEPAPPGR